MLFYGLIIQRLAFAQSAIRAFSQIMGNYEICSVLTDFCVIKLLNFTAARDSYLWCVYTAKIITLLKFHSK